MKKNSTVKPITRMWPLPVHLKGAAAEFYSRAGKELVKAGILTNLDFESYCAMCSAYHLMMEALAEVDKAGMNVSGSRDEVKKNPSSSVFKSASEIFLKYASQFGILPGARANWDISSNGPDMFDDFLSKKVLDDKSRP